MFTIGVHEPPEEKHEKRATCSEVLCCEYSRLETYCTTGPYLSMSMRVMSSE